MKIVLGAFNDDCFWCIQRQLFRVHSMKIVLGAFITIVLGAFNGDCFGCIQ